MTVSPETSILADEGPHRGPIRRERKVHGIGQGGSLFYGLVQALFGPVKNLELPMAPPGFKINTSPEDYRPITQEALASLAGESREQFRELYQA